MWYYQNCLEDKGDDENPNLAILEAKVTIDSFDYMPHCRPFVARTKWGLARWGVGEQDLRPEGRW